MNSAKKSPALYGGSPDEIKINKVQAKRLAALTKVAAKEIEGQIGRASCRERV